MRQIYVIYADVFLVTNVMMNICVLMLAKRIVGRWENKQKLHVILAALLGGLAELLLMYLTTEYVQYLFFSHFVVIPLMVLIGFGWQNVTLYAKNTVVCYGVTLMLGGCVQAIENTVGLDSLPVVSGLLAAILCYEILRRLTKYIRVRSKMLVVKIPVNDVKFQEVKGLMDTGNMLHYTRTGEMVHMISEELLRRIDESKIDFLDVMPYETLQSADGHLELYRLDSMWVAIDGRQKELMNVLIGVSDYDFFKHKDYQLILNADLLNKIGGE